MSGIDYAEYLEGDEWPSESTAQWADGRFKPDLKPIIDMAPQYAVSCLHKLVRWARDGAFTLEQEDEYERRVRSSNLGRLLARQALSIQDFELYAEHGVDREAMSAHQVARALVPVVLHIQENLPAHEVGRLCTEIAVGLIDNGYVVTKVGA